MAKAKHKKRLQRYEVAHGETDLRHFRHTTPLAEIYAFAAEQSSRLPRSVTVWAVSTHGSTGQSSVCIGVFVAGKLVGCAEGNPGKTMKKRTGNPVARTLNPRDY